MESWDVLRDLHFLFAADEGLREDLSYVCDLLTDSSSNQVLPDAATNEYEARIMNRLLDPEQATTKAPKRRKRPVAHTNPSRDRQRQEIDQLKRQVDLLKDQLHETKRKSAMTLDMSAWERVAQEQKVAKSRALKENEELRAATHEYVTFIDEMTRVFHKKRHLTLELEITSEAWQAYKLAAQASLRVAAIHAIAERQYSRLDTAFIRAGVIDREDDLIRGIPIPQPDGRVVVERVYHLKVNAPFRTIMASIWRALNSDRGMHLPEGAVETIESIDPTTVYRAFRQSNGNTTTHWNLLFKYLNETKREVVVWRSVLDDALVPRMSTGTAHDESGWLVVTPIDLTTSRLTLVLNIVAEQNHDGRLLTTEELVDVSATIVDKFSFAHPPEVPGTFPSAPPKTDAEDTDLPFVKRTFVERGKQLEALIKRAVDEAIHEFKAMIINYDQ
ncbi:unnamed protein product [Aphanomyces euteiches]|uniref:Uncharacterized protein n=1 Tax=Aphanomyces euteiches TaxID=100861 RepID=A0A6G0X7B5_9STRA|nr:hypothetical protein Ae201684_007709 [Aphanomyces euteiches]KAH9138794.1 hypothetical protein AeRB84_016907 [Aphanomyces euteiches]